MSISLQYLGKKRKYFSNNPDKLSAKKQKSLHYLAARVSLEIRGVSKTFFNVTNGMDLKFICIESPISIF